MTLQEQINTKLQESMVKKDLETTNNLKVIKGELERQKEKNLSDPQVISILKKMEKNEIELLKLKKEDGSSFLTVIQLFLPKMVDEETIKKFIMENIDFSTLKNKMQAVGIVCKHFGSSTDGNIVKKIVETF